MPTLRGLLKPVCLLALALAVPSTLSAQGIYLQGSGAVNRGMGGATTGTAVDAIGSMYWNPATISQLQQDELAFGLEFVYVNYALSSTFPAVGSGSSEAEIGATPVPTLAWVHQTANPFVKFGFEISGVAGFSSNFRADPTNPILGTPLGTGGTGVGGIKSEAMFYQIASAFSLQMTDRLSIAAGPTVGLAKVSLDENPFVAVNANNLYPRGDGTRYHWGLGAQLGIHYVHNCCWEFGASIKSPTWFEKMRYFSEDAGGLPRTDQLDIDLPMIVSGGLAYKGLEYTLLTLDLRYFDYTTSEGFGDSATYRADGSVDGLGWNDVFAVATGAQFQLTPALTGRLGYIYTTDMIEDEDTFINIPAALDYQHIVTVGASYALNEHATISAAYNYFFEWGSTGEYYVPGAGAIPGSSVTTELDAHIAVIGVNVRY